MTQRYSSAVQQVNYPVHQGKPNPSHGKFFIVGSIPMDCFCHERGRSKIYDTEQQAIDALVAAGSQFIQGSDCRVILKQGVAA